MRLRALALFGLWVAVIGPAAAHAGATLLAQGPVRDTEITATFTKGRLTLTLTARSEASAPHCPFRAEIDAPPALFKTIEGIHYTFMPDRRISPAPVTDASTRFRFEAAQRFGEKAYAEVRLRGTVPRTVLIEGTIRWVERLGHPGRPLAPLLGIHPAVVYQAARRGAVQAREWDRLLGRLGKTT